MQFIDSARFIASFMINLVNNLSEEIYKVKYECKNDDRKCVFFELNINIATVLFNSQNLKMI